MPKTLTYSYSRIRLHVWSGCERLLVEPEGDGVLTSSIVDSGFSNESDDVAGISFQEFFKQS